MAAEALYPSDESMAGAVPIREGEYGAKIAAIEPGGVEYIAHAERHGRPLDLFWTWNSPNWEFATMFLGVIPVTVFGGGFWPTALAVVLGSALGAICVGIPSTWGPKLGVPQLVQARAAFGYWGNLLPAGLNTVTAGVGWFAVNSISGTFALSTLTGLPFQISLLIVVIAQVFIAFIGHNFIHRFEKVTFPYLVVVFVLACIFLFANANTAQGFDEKAPVPFGGPLGAFIIALFISASYGFGWSPYALDFSRYLPKSSDAKSVFWSATLGVFLPCAILELGGVALATIAGTSWGPADSPTDQLVKPLPYLLAPFVLFGITVGTVSANVLNIYSGAMSFLALGLKLGGLKQRRAILAVVFGIIGFFVARSGEYDAGHQYENFLLVIGYWITPYLGVIFTDYLMRRGQFNEAELYDTRNRKWTGFAAMAIGIVASEPFWNQAFWLGAFAKAYPNLGDLSFIVGFVVASAVYYALSRGKVAPATTA
ncbi:MAG: cytosine permease [Chloroflexota bacterium]